VETLIQILAGVGLAGLGTLVALFIYYNIIRSSGPSSYEFLYPQDKLPSKVERGYRSVTKYPEVKRKS